MTRVLSLALAAGLFLLAHLTAGRLAGQDFEQEPISYSKGKSNDRVTRLIEQLESGDKELPFDKRFGFLKPLLQELEIPESSQTLVFSKTSLQRQRIAPRTPRALYFNDDTYVGYCQNGEVLEIASVDPQLGAVFYVIDQTESSRPRIVRETDNCLICHGSSQTKHVPGFVVRSLYVNRAGLPLLAEGTHRIDQTSPIEHRWGGWYVTGKHGDQKHLGNLVIETREVPRDLDLSPNLNLTDLGERFDKSEYLTPHSDLVALMVLEHQADMHNYITAANYGVRQAMHYQASLNRELKQPEDHLWDSTKSRIKSVCEPLLAYLLFSEEAKLTAKMEGTSKFAEEFAARGPRDSKGRSLRDFDLERRMFKYPCSYLIYTDHFQQLPPEAKEYIYRRLHEVLTGKDTTKRFAHLSTEDRTAIREILLETLPDLPDYWRTES
jgi:hypothetical protein